MNYSDGLSDLSKEPMDMREYVPTASFAPSFANSKQEVLPIPNRNQNRYRWVFFAKEHVTAASTYLNHHQWPPRFFLSNSWVPDVEGESRSSCLALSPEITGCGCTFEPSKFFKNKLISSSKTRVGVHWTGYSHLPRAKFVKLVLVRTLEEKLAVY